MKNQDNVFARLLKSFVEWPNSQRLADVLMDMTDEEAEAVKNHIELCKSERERIYNNRRHSKSPFVRRTARRLK